MIEIKPSWFFGVDSVFEIIFAIVTIILAVYAFHVYKICKEKRFSMMGLAFLFIGFGYIIKSAFNYALFTKVHENSMSTSVEMLLNEVAILTFSGIFLHGILMLLGWMILIFMAYKIKDKRIISLFVLMLLVMVFLNSGSLNEFSVMFFIISTLFLVFLVTHFAKNYRKIKNKNSLMVLIAFASIAISQIIFALVHISRELYVAGHIFELGGYLLLLINLLLVLRR